MMIIYEPPESRTTLIDSSDPWGGRIVNQDALYANNWYEKVLISKLCNKSVEIFLQKFRKISKESFSHNYPFDKILGHARWKFTNTFRAACFAGEFNFVLTPVDTAVISYV